MVVEVLTFALAPGATPEDFLVADARVQTEFFYLQPGIVRRTTARDGDRFVVVTFWRSRDDALRAWNAVPDEFTSLITDVTVQRSVTLD